MTGRGEGYGGRAEPSVDALPSGYQPPVWKALRRVVRFLAASALFGRWNLCWFGARNSILVLVEGKAEGGGARLAPTGSSREVEPLTAFLGRVR